MFPRVSLSVSLRAAGQIRRRGSGTEACHRLQPGHQPARYAWGSLLNQGGTQQAKKIVSTIAGVRQTTPMPPRSVGRWPPKTTTRRHQEYKLVTQLDPESVSVYTGLVSPSQAEELRRGYRRFLKRQRTATIYDTDSPLADAYRAKVAAAREEATRKADN